MPSTSPGDANLGVAHPAADFSRATASGSPSPWGLEALGKRRKEFAAGEGPQRAERAGASESLGRGEGGRSTHFAAGLGFSARSQRGIALVVTLILLSVITFLAVAFLFLARRERGAVATTVEQSVAKLATEAAVERAKAEMAAAILATTNQFAYDLRVSTNYINYDGFVSGNNTLTNVNYDYRTDGSALTQNDLLQNIANLYYSPRPPVFIQTNRNFPDRDFRYWLDLNRNGRFDTNGLLPELTGNAALPYVDTNGNWTASLAEARFSSFVGDPEWIGILDRTDRPHAPNNKFVARYAYIIVPSGKTLDWNTIHNQAKRNGPGQEGFIRNMGVGTWEMNLASFLVDLNTNVWEYGPGVARYNYQPFGAISTGTAFEDALDIVRYRYNFNFNNLFTVQDLYGTRGAEAFRTDLADGYSKGPLMTTRNLPVQDPDLQPADNTGAPWSGAANPNHYLTTQDLFDGAKVSFGRTPTNTFVDRLLSTGYGNSSYDRYTYYRLLSQIGTDTGPEQPSGKLHLNYRNAMNGAVVPGMETNFIPWTALDFFTNAADKLLRSYYPNPGDNVALFNVRAPLSLTNIPVVVSNQFVYAASLHRVFQLAANLADAQTNYAASRDIPRQEADLPSVFRPTFRKNADGDIFIAGWVEENDTSSLNLGKVLDLTDPADRAAIPANAAAPIQANAYSVPWVIGAKKGLPNFNEFMMKSVASVTRRLQFHRPTIGAAPTRTNQMFQVGVSNMFGFEAWNPYAANYNRAVRIFVDGSAQIQLRYTNDVALDARSGVLSATVPFVAPPTNIPALAWRGAGPSISSPVAASFQIPLFTNFLFMADAVLRTDQGAFPRFDGSTNRNIMLGRAGFEETGKFYIPQFDLSVSNRIRFIMVDTTATPNRVIDYVCLNQLDGVRDMTRELSEGSVAIVGGNAINVGGDFWATNRFRGNTLQNPPQGVINQIEASLGNIATGDTEWRNYGVNQYQGNLKQKEIASFRAFMGYGQINSAYAGTENTNLTVQAPFTPTRRTSQTISWQANDPLVHYTKADLTYAALGNGIMPELPNGPLNSSNSIGKLNERFEPWSEEIGDKNTRTNLALKDPGLRSPNDWDFPTNKFPSVGWIGRVHRGTPWQTVYLKSTDVALRTWTNWSGNVFQRDALLTRPVADRVLFDVFTTAFNDNATRGQLNVNQEGLAAWSAALGGVIGLTNDATDAALQYGTNMVSSIFIRPAGTEVNPTNSIVHRIWAGVNRTRADTNLFRGSFKRAGDVLATPELTVESPLLNRSSNTQLARGIDDATYERLPQMLMGLLRGNEAPRFTIFAYGQALKPAERSIVTGGPYAGLCTNYQITAEFVTRTVVRLEDTPNAPRAVVESYNVLGPE